MTGLCESDRLMYYDTAATCSRIYKYEDWGTGNSINNNIEYKIKRNYSVNATNLIDVDWDVTSTAYTAYTGYKEIDQLITSATHQWYGGNIDKLIWRVEGSGNRVTVPVSPGDRMREILRSRSAPAIIRSNRKRQALMVATDIREIRARATLRGILGDQSFRRFLRDGFISVVSKSGLTYRVYPGHGTTEVYDRGIMVERMCVVLKGNFPPTDALIMRYLLILNDEGEFSRYAVRSRVSRTEARSVTLKIPQVKSLPELFAELKSVA